MCSSKRTTGVVAHEEVVDVSQEALSLTSSSGGCVHVELIYVWVSVKLQNLHED